MPPTLSDDFIRSVRDAASAGKPVRHRLPAGGLLYLDRPLPFLCVYRHPARRDDATARLVTGQAAYLVAPGDTPFSAGVSALVRTLAEVFSRQFERFLLVEVWSTPEKGEGEECEPHTFRPAFCITSPASDALAEPVEAMAKALKRVSVHKQASALSFACEAAPAPPGLPPLLSCSEQERLQSFVVGVEVLPVYREAATGLVFPVLFEALRARFSDALKQAGYAFACSQTTLRPAHPRALGQRRLQRTVKDVDRQLAAIDASFEFLLQSTPLNAGAAWEAFQEEGFTREPVFYYRPLLADPERLKRRLFSIPVERVDDPALAQLFREKQEELDRQITMLRDRDTRQFYFGSLQLFGEVRPELLALAKEILERLPVHDDDLTSEDHLDAAAFAEVAGQEHAYYRQACTAFPETVQIRDDIPAGLMVSRGQLLIGRGTKIPASRVDALLQHEVGTHMVTFYNGQAQPLRLLSAGLAGYEALQEGLAVLAEYLVGGITIPRLRVLAARVVAAHCLIEGAPFLEVFSRLRETYDFAPHLAFTVTMRTFRGGGLVKDVVYLRGLQELMTYLREGGALEPLLLGKIALHHVPLLEELAQRGVLREAPLRPRYLEKAGVAERLERVQSGLTFVDLVEKSLS